MSSVLVRITFVDESDLKHSLADAWLTTEEHYNNNNSNRLERHKQLTKRSFIWLAITIKTACIKVKKFKLTIHVREGSGLFIFRYEGRRGARSQFKFKER